MRDFSRTDRIAGTILRELSILLQTEIKDPRLPKFVTISEVTVTKDLSHAKVYFTVLNEDKELTLDVLNRSAKYLRGRLAKLIKLRTIPELHFVYDESVEYGKRISKIIDEIVPDNDSDEDQN